MGFRHLYWQGWPEARIALLPRDYFDANHLTSVDSASAAPMHRPPTLRDGRRGARLMRRWRRVRPTPGGQIFLDSLIAELKTWQPVTEAIIAQRDAEATDASC
jgi:hypothetical protein